MSNPAPRCLCIICREERSSRGIHSHYLIAHTKEGKEKHLQTSLKALKTATAASIAARKTNKLHHETEYNNNPNHCECCESILLYEQRNQKFCSRSCSAKTIMPGRIISQEQRDKTSESLFGRPSSTPKFTSIKFCICEICNIEFIWNSISRGAQRFCSKECSHINRSNKARNNPGLGTKRSKLEIELFELCNAHFNIVMPNEKIVKGWDADIVIHDTKTAILWNGPWHYREMNFGNHSLKQVQNRDKIKIREFTNAGWNVIIFEDRHFTPQSAFDTLLVYREGNAPTSTTYEEAALTSMLTIHKL